jgi:biopolymer transport protein ExbB
LSFIKLISVVAPLLGLLGTVTGMIITFQAITLFGSGDPKVMAGGISQALVSTVMGLTVAVPLVFSHSLLNGRARRLAHVLQEQSAGLIAAHAERVQRDV